MKKLYTNLLLEIIPVMIGVYLGFALNNFGQNQKLQKQGATYKDMIRNEIEGNLTSINDVYTYHKDLNEDFKRIMKSPDIKEAFGKYTLKGLRPGFVNESALTQGFRPVSFINLS